MPVGLSLPSGAYSAVFSATRPVGCSLRPSARSDSKFSAFSSGQPVGRCGPGGVQSVSSVQFSFIRPAGGPLRPRGRSVSSVSSVQSVLPQEHDRQGGHWHHRHREHGHWHHSHRHHTHRQQRALAPLPPADRHHSHRLTGTTAPGATHTHTPQPLTP